MHLGDVARLALNGVRQDRCLDPVSACLRGGGLERERCRSDGAHAIARKQRVAGQRRLIVVASQQGLGVRGQINAVERDIFAGQRAGPGQRDGGTRSDDGRIIARHVGYHQCSNPRGRAAGGQPAALDGRKLVPDQVHHRNGRARRQQGSIDCLFVVQREAGRRGRQQGRSAAGNQSHHQVIGPQTGHCLHYPAGRQKTGFIGYRMGRLDDLDALAGLSIAVAGHHQSADRTVPFLLEGMGHLRRRLAGTDNHGAPPGTFRQVLGHRQGGLGLGHGSSEHLLKQGSVHWFSRLAIRGEQL